MYLYAYNHTNKYDLSFVITIYNPAHRLAKRAFYLRNLRGKTEAEQIEYAKQIMDAVAEEIYYLSGFGVDKGVVKSGARKVSETVYHGFEPKPGGHFFHESALVSFRMGCYHLWGNAQTERGHLRITEDSLASEEWEIKTEVIYKKVFFQFPIVTIPEWRRSNYPPESITFFGIYNRTGRKRRRDDRQLAYDRNDSVLKRFLERFRTVGNLSFGKRRYFANDNTHIEILEGRWPKSKAKSKRHPRKSQLASQPVDNTDYVYLIQMGRIKIYKIGKTNDPQGRLVSLQTASPYKLKLLHTFKADNASAAEENLHETLHNARMEGEWFRLSDEQRAVLLKVTEYKNGNFVTGDKKEVNANELLSL